MRVGSCQAYLSLRQFYYLTTLFRHPCLCVCVCVCVCVCAASSQLPCQPLYVCTYILACLRHIYMCASIHKACISEASLSEHACGSNRSTSTSCPCPCCCCSCCICLYVYMYINNIFILVYVINGHMYICISVFICVCIRYVHVCISYICTYVYM